MPYFSSVPNERCKIPAPATAVRHFRRWPVSSFLADDLSHFPEYKKSSPRLLTVKTKLKSVTENRMSF